MFNKMKRTVARGPNADAFQGFILRLASGALALAGISHSVAGWGLTEVGSHESDWLQAEWSHGVPSETDTVYIDGGAKIRLSGRDKIEVYGIRMGAGEGMPTLQNEMSYLRTHFIVVGDGSNASGTFIQAGGMVEVTNTNELDFELGNPATIPTEDCYSLATFAAGQSSLGDLRFNLSAKRKSRLTVYGVLPRVVAESVSFALSGEETWHLAELSFVFSEEGIAPLLAKGIIGFGDGDRVRLMIDGSKYKGRGKTFPLCVAGDITGKPAEVVIEGLSGKATVQQDGDRLNLVIH